ncbi:hypothetical protein F4809DRAFT_427455 [Biscogniauxia mediterranea]|nr:hypothetical protein F4809DRAFT_427455 [Biscogniauxia mediterranea]
MQRFTILICFIDSLALYTTFSIDTFLLMGEQSRSQTPIAIINLHILPRIAIISPFSLYVVREKAAFHYTLPLFGSPPPTQPPYIHPWTVSVRRRAWSLSLLSLFLWGESSRRIYTHTRARLYLKLPHARIVSAGHEISPAVKNKVLVVRVGIKNKKKGEKGKRRGAV